MNIAEILAKHVDENGAFNAAEAEKELKEAQAREFVPKHEFNTKNDQLKTANQTIETLQKDNKDNEKLQADVQDYQTKLAAKEAEISKLQLTKSAEDALRDKKVKNVNYALFAMGDLELDAEGKIKDFDSKFEAFKTTNPDQVEADKPAEQAKPKLFGASPALLNPAQPAKELSYGAQMGKLVAEQKKGGIL